VESEDDGLHLLHPLELEPMELDPNRNRSHIAINPTTLWKSAPPFSFFYPARKLDD